MSKKLFVQALQEIMHVSESMQDILKVTRDRRDAESRLKSSFAQEYAVAREGLEYLVRARSLSPNLSESIEGQNWHTEHLIMWLIEEYGLKEELSNEAPSSKSMEPAVVLDKLSDAKFAHPENPIIAQHQSECMKIYGNLLATCRQPTIIIFTEVLGVAVVLNKLSEQANGMFRSCLYPLRKFINKHADLVFETRFTDSHITYIPMSEGQDLQLLYEAFEAAARVVTVSKDLYGNNPSLRRLRRVKPGIQIAMDVGDALILQKSVRSEHVSKGLIPPNLMIKAGIPAHQFCISRKIMEMVRDNKRRGFVFERHVRWYRKKRVVMFEVTKA